MGIAVVEGRIVYTTPRNPMKAGYAKTDAYRGGQNGCAFARKGFRSSLMDGDSALFVQLQSIRLVLSIAESGRWTCRAAGLSRVAEINTPREKRLRATAKWRSIDIRPIRKLAKPLRGLIATCNDWYVALRAYSLV